MDEGQTKWCGRLVLLQRSSRRSRESVPRETRARRAAIFWVLVKGCKLKATMKKNYISLLVTIDPYYGNLSYIPQQEPSLAGPLSDGIAKALDYGAWGGGDVEAPLAGSRQSFIPVLAPWEHREVT